MEEEGGKEVEGQEEEKRDRAKLPVSVKSASSSKSSVVGPGWGALSSASLTSSSWTIVGVGYVYRYDNIVEVVV